MYNKKPVRLGTSGWGGACFLLPAKAALAASIHQPTPAAV